MTGYSGLDSLPLPLLGLLLAIGFFVLAMAGNAAHRRFGGKSDGESSEEEQVLSTSHLLLALLLGFTFSMALGRYDTRRELVVQESNDIGTAWLRAGLYDGPAAKALQAKLAEYARTRIGGRDTGPGAQQSVRKAGAVLRGEIWKLTAATTAPERSTAQSASLVAAVNAVLDTGAEREAMIDARVPQRVLVLLIVYSAVSAFMLGYVLAASGSRHRVASVVLFVLLSMTITLILDLDRPQGGYIRVSQQPMIDLVADIGRPESATKALEAAPAIPGVVN